MGYLDIENLYRYPLIFNFKEVYAMEKIHGTSAHITYKEGKISYFSGGEKYESFKALFDEASLLERFAQIGHSEVEVYGEAYGGKCQGMSTTYGKQLKFVVFDVKVSATWLNVPNAEDVTTKLGLEFVPYKKIENTLENLDIEKLKQSEQGCRNNGGLPIGNLREGIVIRPLEVFRDSRGNRVICKYKNEEFSERKKEPKVIDGAELQLLTEAKEIADEWVTDMRLNHVLDKLQVPLDTKSIPDVIKAMIADVEKESVGEIEMTKEARREIGHSTVLLYKKLIENNLREIANG